MSKPLKTGRTVDSRPSCCICGEVADRLPIGYREDEHYLYARTIHPECAEGTEWSVSDDEMDYDVSFMTDVRSVEMLEESETT